MKKLQLRSIEPRSFVRLSLYFAFPAGLWIGVFVFLISFLGGANVSLKLPWGTYSGLEAGVMGLVFIPLLVPLVAVFYAFLGHWPFEWFLRLTNGVTLEGDWDAAET